MTHLLPLGGWGCVVIPYYGLLTYTLELRGPYPPVPPASGWNLEGEQRAGKPQKIQKAPQDPQSRIACFVMAETRNKPTLLKDPGDLALLQAPETGSTTPASSLAGFSLQPEKKGAAEVAHCRCQETGCCTGTFSKEEDSWSLTGRSASSP